MDGVVQRARGNAAVVMRTHGGEIRERSGKIGGARLACHLGLRELQQVGDADVGVMLNRHAFGVAQGQLGAGWRLRLLWVGLRLLRPRQGWLSRLCHESRAGRVGQDTLLSVDRGI